jgi:hypothetical protein
MSFILVPRWIRREGLGKWRREFSKALKRKTGKN